MTELMLWAVSLSQTSGIMSVELSVISGSGPPSSFSSSVPRQSGWNYDLFKADHLTPYPLLPLPPSPITKAYFWQTYQILRRIISWKISELVVQFSLLYLVFKIVLPYCFNTLFSIRTVWTIFILWTFLLFVLAFSSWHIQKLPFWRRSDIAV